MKKIILFATALISAVIFCSFILVKKMTSDVLRQLGVEESAAQQNVWSSFSGGYFSYPYSQNIKNVAVADRARMVQGIGEFAKSYTRSDDFRQKYAQHREDMKPQPSDGGMPDKDKQREDLKNAIKQTEDMIKQFPDQRTTFEEVLKMQKQQLKDLDDPNSPMNSKQMQDAMEQGNQQAQAEYQEELKKWEREYPASPNVMIKKRLKDFLEISKDIDFNAALTKSPNGKMKFQNPAYEAKDGQWKMCFRSGRESVTAARVYAQQWLNELN